MLYEVIAAVECPLRFRLGPALLILVCSHMGIIRMHLTAEGTRLQGGGFGIAADPGRAQGVDRIFMANPFVLGLEGTRTERAKEGQVLLRLASAIDSVD
jgi:hypothetical protein